VFAGATHALRKDIPKLAECAQESLFTVRAESVQPVVCGGERFMESENHRLLAVILVQIPNHAHEEIQSHMDNALVMAR
jgi:hypothetical protein